MRKFTQLLSFFFILVFCTTCMQGNYLEVTQTSFKQEVSPKENITFTFNKNLVGDTLLNVWDSTQYLSFSPAVQGQFKWVAPNQLVFSPLNGFQPSTDYEIKLHEQLVRGKKGITLKENALLKFHTTYLRLESSDIFWSQDDRRTNQLTIHLNFNYQVNPANIQELISAKVEAQPIAVVRVLNTEPSNKIEVALEEVSSLDLNNKLIELEIAPGLKCAESNYTTKEKISLQKAAPNKNHLSIEDIISEYDQNKTQLRVKTNQSVSITQVINHLKIEPQMVFEVQEEEGGFLIKANFTTGSSYTIRMDKEMQGVFGANLGQDYEQNIVFGARPPIIEFTENNGLYLSSKGSKNIGIRIHSIPNVKVTIYKIYENNLIHYLNLSDNYPYVVDNRIEHYGDIISEREYETKALPLINDFRVLNLDMNENNKTRGIYMVEVRSTEEMWRNARKMVAISDIGFIVKETKDDILVFANAIISAQPMAGVNISLMSQSNQTLSQMETNSEGVAVFSDIKKKFPKGNIRLITANNGNDFNYIYFNRSEVDQSSFETGGVSLAESGYQAFIYGERDLYRPSETINLNILMRDRLWQPIGKIPVKLKLKMPNGKDLSSLRLILDDQGAQTVSIKLPPSVITGTYFAEVYTSTDVLLESMPISVEEFVPDRIRTQLKLLEKDLKTPLKGDLKPGDSARVQLTAQNLFGPPAANRNYEMNFSLVKAQFKAKNFPEYAFDVSSQSDNPYIGGFLTSKSTEGQTNEQGMAFESFYLSEEYVNQGLLRGNVYTTVFDETGRSVSRVMNFDVFTQESFLGIKTFDEYISTNRTLQIPVIALDKDQNVRSAKATVQFVRYKWLTVLEKDRYGSLEYVSRKKEEILKEEEINIQGANTTVSFIPNLSGSYEIRLKQAGAKTYVMREFYAYGYNYTDNTSFEVNKDGKINIKLDKTSYKIGEQAKVLFTTPFNGRMLVTIERDKVFKYFYLNTTDKSASTTLDITDEYLPNVYITATLIRPMSEGALPLTVAHGFEPLLAEDPQSKLTLSIEAMDKTESKQKQIIKVKTNRAESDIQVTLAVVDEGILQLKNYKTPDPHAYFFRKRRLDVNAFDMYPQLFPEISIGTKSVGGGGPGLDERNNSMVNKRIKLVRFWSGVLKTNAVGEVSYTIDIPQFSGSLRIMAVAYKNGAFGSAQKSMTVADPIVVSTGLPRFLSPNDVIKVPVTIFNTTNQNAQAQINLAVSNNLSIVGEKTFSTEVKANQEKQVEFEIKAAQVIDSAQVNVSVNALGRVFTEELDINIRPVVGLVKLASAGKVDAGMSQSFTMSHDLSPATIRSQLFVSKSPMIQFADNLDYLIEYPYGCVEQVTSTVFPQLYAQDLMKVITPRKQNTELYASEIRENIQEGIMRLQSRQTYEGGLSYWPGGEVNAFGTAYAAHFMIEAKTAGYFVNQSTLDQMLQYLRQGASRKELQDYYYFEKEGKDRKRRKKRIAPKESIYALYVLALAKTPDIPMMNYYKENPQVLALDSRYLLAAAYLISGDKSSFQILLPTAFQGEISENVLTGSFHSYLRDEALALNALIEADPGNVQISTLAQHLSQQLKASKYLSTQEQAFGLLALGKLARQVKKANVQGEVRIANQAAASLINEDIIIREGLAGNNVQIKAQGEGSLYYFWQMKGLSATGKVKEIDKGLKVRKTFFDRNGNLIKNNTFRQNDLIVVKISISAEPYFNNLENVVITDMLPAGLEIENPRLIPNQAISFVQNQNYPDYVDMRDDRIHYFATATGEVQEFYYLARAVTKGTFQMGPVSADAMYSGDYYSYHGAGTIQIVDARSVRNN
ncbi:MAG: MG2 domain-containing protein [Microscillaceae bacterium]|nr:MG2 domain-containing protein [Microscillaceae bacterium]